MAGGPVWGPGFPSLQGCPRQRARVSSGRSEGWAGNSGQGDREEHSSSQPCLVGRRAPHQQGWPRTGGWEGDLRMNWVLSGPQGPAGSQAEPLRGGPSRLSWSWASSDAGGSLPGFRAITASDCARLGPLHAAPVTCLQVSQCRSDRDRASVTWAFPGVHAAHPPALPSLPPCCSHPSSATLSPYKLVSAQCSVLALPPPAPHTLLSRTPHSTVHPYPGRGAP